ncbi:hypothetical protein ELE36_08625 [Pseudolysobacter antarcticus]|uniref:Uncharacterized protein n=1 Tax=Pseudolysobacter antarcticus TaxID=2511995 RepID=A0A411HIS4_9GAMM|nr:hypothetical protein [Pseudolysobacter antarcticus]QBB70426.1 hypothetical protein ELE36_08625 [Pseudolysobacter antarcticus]
MAVSIRVCSIFCANLLALIAPAAFAANLVPDPDFNAGNVSSWPSAGSSTSISFDATQNILGTVGSGSALLTNGNANYNANSTLCLPGSYAAGVWLRRLVARGRWPIQRFGKCRDWTGVLHHQRLQQWKYCRWYNRFTGKRRHMDAAGKHLDLAFHSKQRRDLFEQ